MQTENVSPAEWRWVAIFSGILVALTLIPYAWALSASDSTYVFMGVLFNPLDSATYLSKIQQGIDGAWLFELRHTPQSHDPAGFHLFYLLLGHLARLLGLSDVVIFHLARVATNFFMFTTLYHLGASIWTRIRPRRLFFALTAVGSGMGWLALVFSNEQLAPDLFVPEGFPLLAAYTNPHFPLAIGCGALAAAIFLRAFRPGFTEAPTIDNGGISLVILSIVLSLVSPQLVITLGSTLVAYILVRGYILTSASRKSDKYKKKLKESARTLTLFNFEFPLHEVRWASMYILPAFPVALYYIMVYQFNDTFGDFNNQNVTDSPNIILFVFGYGLLLIVAIPGLIRAFRQFEPDGDQLMLVWVVANITAIYVPFALQRRFFLGLIIPIVYFAVRAIEDYWLEMIVPRLHVPALILMFVFILPTHAFTFGAPLAFTVFDREAGAENWLLLRQDYLDVFDYLDRNAQANDVVLASPQIGLWLPSKTAQRPFYGHEFETVPAGLRYEQMLDFYQGVDCQTILSGEGLPFTIDYVLWGPNEDSLGYVEDTDSRVQGIEDDDGDDLILLPNADRCRPLLEEAAIDQREIGLVTLYQLR
jgi:hypothetical protein